MVSSKLKSGNPFVSSTHISIWYRRKKEKKNDGYENPAGTQLFTVNPFYAFMLFDFVSFFLQVIYMQAAALSGNNCERLELESIIHFIGGKIYNRAAQLDI